MAYVPHARDERDRGGDKAVRASFIGPLTTPGDSWLVYGNSMDCIGAVQHVPHVGDYAASFHGKCLGRRKTLRGAIALLLEPHERKEFEGKS